MIRFNVGDYALLTLEGYSEHIRITDIEVYGYIVKGIAKKSITFIAFDEELSSVSYQNLLKVLYD